MSDTILDRSVQPNPVSFWEAVIYWIKLGFISFGGPAGQISMMHQELVERRRWISEQRFLHALNYTMVLPGPEAQQLATYIGWLMHGVRGGIAAGVLFVLPSLFILITLTWLYLTYGEVPAVAGILYGIKPAVTAVVLFAAFRIGSKALPNPILKAMAATAFIAIFFFKVPFPFIVLVAGIFAYIGSRYAPDTFKAGGHHGSSKESYGVAIIDDDTPAPSHALFKWSRVFSFLAVGLGLWVAVMGFLFFQYGWEGTLTQMGNFFTKAALLTIGGAYAVLPYVHQGGVDNYQWLTGTQMMDGLALGETTPGPLIMVVAFVGFVGGWTKEVLGPDMLFLSGVVAASVVTFFTFLPSFLFIFIGGPAIEATRNDLKFTAPLTGITAAVVGVILNLAAFFAYHVLWPNGLDLAMPSNFTEISHWVTSLLTGFDWFSGLIGLLMFIALVRFKIGIMTVILTSAIIGVAYSMLLGI
ncbi:MAG: chromate efflux transporter [Thiotrichaceae bacterium]|nr:chromate efflux transporter [Thiotrichaceae bacterium]